MPVKHELPYFVTYQPTLSLDRDRGKYVSRPVRPPSQSSFPSPPKRISIVLVIIFSAFAFYLGVLFYFAFPFKFSHTIDRDLHDVRILYNLVDVQNKTINTLVSRVKTLPYLQSFYDSKKSATPELAALHQAKRYDSLTKRERECEMRYGLSLADEWRGTEETWCQSETNIPGKVSSLKCYPYQQQHRAEQGKGKDVFCVAENFVIDFSLVRPLSMRVSLRPHMFTSFYPFWLLDSWRCRTRWSEALQSNGVFGCHYEYSLSSDVQTYSRLLLGHLRATQQQILHEFPRRDRGTYL